ncbi:hypothetical protein [Streptomyces formicae]|uniref:Integral membrane protein n=1 Tax=Streptomyces formicae TaxID=1616117 RepID=A0ABY3WIY1_9ACTN|nr:hypothetical protein [Streptomyces formicae]UNM12544.1 hypothetical protein J4032_14300 [Streptomyces formicae]
MSTTRHLINRQRRLVRSATAPAPAAVRNATDAPPPRPAPEPPPESARSAQSEESAPAESAESAESAASAARPRRARAQALPAALCVLTVLLGGFAAWAGIEASALHDDPAVRNTALTDVARTTEVKGQVADAVNAVFSYNYAATAANDRAVKDRLTGRAVAQHREMLATVRAKAAAQKLVLTTTVTESGVELIDGDRARVLVFADQSNTSTASLGGTTFGAAMFAVDLVRMGDLWRIANIETFGASS